MKQEVRIVNGSYQEFKPVFIEYIFGWTFLFLWGMAVFVMSVEVSSITELSQQEVKL